MVVVCQDKKDSMMDEKHLHNLVGYEHYKSSDLFSQKEDEQCTLEEGKEQILEVGTHQACREDKVVILEDSRWCLGCHPDKIVRNMFQKEHDLIPLLVDYEMSTPQHGVE